MQEDVLSSEITSRVYTENAICVATLLGGPVVAGYLIAQNFENLGQGYKVKKTWAYTIIGTLLICILPELLPFKIPNIVFPFLYTITAFYIVKYYQGPAITSHIENGGATCNFWRAVLIGAIGMIALIIIFLAFFIVMEVVHPGFLG